MSENENENVSVMSRFMTPTNVAAVTILFVNDHFLKRMMPGFITGKLSDVAGMIFFPALLHLALWSLASRRMRFQARASAKKHDALLLSVCLIVALVFTLTKTTMLGNEAYRLIWGAMQWPFQALNALAHGHAIPNRIAKVVLVRDPTDVLAVPFVLLTYVSGRISPFVKRVGTRGPATRSRNEGRVIAETEIEFSESGLSTTSANAAGNGSTL